MSHDAMNAVWQGGPAKHSHLVLLLRVADNINDVTGEWALSVPFLAKHARISERHMPRVIALLEKERWLECRREPGKAIVYRLGKRFTPCFNTEKGKWEYGTPAKMAPLTERPEGGAISSAEVPATPDTQMAGTPAIHDGTHTVVHPHHNNLTQDTKARGRADLPEGVRAETWTAYLDIRRAKRAKVTPEGLRLLKAQLADFTRQHYDPQEVVELCVREGWTGLKWALPHLKRKHSIPALGQPTGGQAKAAEPELVECPTCHEQREAANVVGGRCSICRVSRRIAEAAR